MSLKSRRSFRGSPRKINVFAEIIIPVLWKSNNFLQEIFFFLKAAEGIAFICGMCYNGSAFPEKNGEYCLLYIER